MTSGPNFRTSPIAAPRATSSARADSTSAAKNTILCALLGPPVGLSTGPSGPARLVERQPAPAGLQLEPLLRRMLARHDGEAKRIAEEVRALLHVAAEDDHPIQRHPHEKL